MSNHEFLQADQPGPPSERSTGLVFAGVFALLALWLRGNTVAMSACLAASGGFLALALMRPALLGPLNRVWFRLSLLMHRVVSPVVMLAMFVLVFTPVGLVMRIFRDPLRRRRAPVGVSYWTVRETVPESSMKNQF